MLSSHFPFEMPGKSPREGQIAFIPSYEYSFESSSPDHQPVLFLSSY